MATKVKRRAMNTTQDTVGMSAKESILQDVQSLYRGDDGLTSICKSLGVACQRPRKTISILIIGNHSAGKSSFVNWFTGQNIQTVGVAIETSGFTFITPGKKRDTLAGPATVQLFPPIAKIAQDPGMMEHLHTEVITPPPSRANAHLITFIDSPGLVDGNIKYPFNVEKAMAEFAAFADLVFVFFDPIGQALCSRTMNVIARLNDAYPEKLRFYLSKADTVPSESDRQKVLIQITQNLTQYLRNKTFTLPTIYLPNQPGPASEVLNKINEVVDDMDKTIQLAVQGTLTNLEKDCNQSLQVLQSKIEVDSATRSRNTRGFFRLVFGGLALTFGIVLILLSLLHPLVHTHKFWVSTVGPLTVHTAPYLEGSVAHTLLAVSIISLILLGLTSRKRPTLTKAEAAMLRTQKVRVAEALEAKGRLMQDMFRELGVDSDHH
eukprot:TRINITY_DN15053_c0_g1_i1.p1 TRINITY_DN15053_c0_g1~~TRINITY_DN15053_c0_g1_i1.p1  ORF type:complete len:449 (-),score=67.49 TRINITY_DN15053_c0_g1_i1:40-1344(-)